MSKGQKIIGTFNPSGNPEVDAIKEKAAELIDLIHSSSPATILYGFPAKDRAVNKIEEGTMLAVKSIMHK